MSYINKSAYLGALQAHIDANVPIAIIEVDEMNEFCKGMPRYKRPKQIIFADIPRNPTGKIEKPKLRKMYSGDSVVAKQNEIKLG